MFKKGFAALVCLAILSALTAWAATTYQVQTKIATAGGTIKLRNNPLQTSVGTTTFTNFTTSAPVPVTVAANAGYAISSVTKGGVAQVIVNPSSFSTSFLKSSGTIQNLIATFAAQQLSVTSDVSGSGSISPTSATVSYGGSAVFQATPATTRDYLTAVSGGTVTDTMGNPVTLPFGGTAKITVANVTSSRPVAVSFLTVGANAGASQLAMPNSQVTLSGSLTGGGDPSWNQTSGPAVILAGAGTLTPSFSASAAGQYQFQLTQMLGGKPVSSSSVQVTVVSSVTDNMKSSCMGCHGSGGAAPSPAVFSTWSSSGHKTLGVSCVTCHTDGAMPTPVNTASVSAASWLVNSASAGTPGSYYCVKCHDQSIGAGYGASLHKANGVTCQSCHTQGVHNPAPLVTACNGCHLDGNGSVANHPFDIAGAACITCHNPHSTSATLAGVTGAHYNNITSGMYPASYVTSRATCSNCHVPNAENAAIRQQWAASGHADTQALPWIDYDFKTRAGCVQCHTTTGFVAFSTAKLTAAWGVASDKTKELLTCVACHSDVAAGTVRSVTPVRPFADEAGYQNHNVGNSNVCMDCHSGRNNGASIAVKAATGDFMALGFIAPHYLSAGGSLQAKSGYHFPGRTYVGYSSNSHRDVGMADRNATGTSGPCAACHMSAPEKHRFTPVTHDQTGAVSALTTTLCSNCHQSSLPAATLELKRQAFANALDALQAQLAASGHPYSAEYPYFAAGNWGTGQAGANVMGAAFNYKLLVAEPGAYAHNSDYAKQLIVDSIDALYHNGTLTGDISAALTALVGSGAISQQAADSVASYQAASTCTSCHANTSGSHTKHLASALSCADCHSLTARSNTALISGTDKHINGVRDVNLAAGGSYGAGTCSVYCHSNGAGSFINPTWGVGSSNCLFCHPLSALRGAHAAHIGNPDSLSYGDTADRSTATEYRFGCGNCHPTALASHRDGHIDVTLVPTADGSLRSKNDPSVVVGGIGNSGSGIGGLSGSSVVCSASYCHSNGAVGAALSYLSSPDWYNAQAYTGSRCTMCHGNAPTSGAHAAHAVGIHYSQIYDGVGNLLPAAAGPGVAAGHGDPAQSTTLNCDLCHSATVTNSSDDYGTSCASCHKGTPSVYKVKHLNGSVDVAFKGINVVTKAQVRPTSFGKYSTFWTRTSYKTGAGSFDTSKLPLSQGGWDGTAKSCSNVACHNGGTPTWSGKLSCVDCHTSL